MIQITIEKPYWWCLLPFISLGYGKEGWAFVLEFLLLRFEISRGYSDRIISLPYLAVNFGNVFYRIELDLYITKEHHYGYAFWRRIKKI